MRFTRFEDNVSVHQGLSDEPNIDDGLTAEELKKKFDEPAEKLKKVFNDLTNELENNTSAKKLGAQKLNNADNSDENIQAKLESLQSQITTINNTNIATSKIEDGAITTSKIANANVTTDKIADSSVTTNKINNGSVTGEKIDENVKKASNITATALNEQDTSEGNVQAKLSKIYQDLIAMTQGSVADNSIVSSKIVNKNITTEKLADKCVTKEKINFGLYLVPSGFIGMWSGSDVPDGWYLCDGTNGTPDLRNRFIVGAGSTYNIGDTGGSESVVLTENQMPTHTHETKMLSHDSHYWNTSGTHDILSTHGHTEDAGLGIAKRSSSYLETKYDFTIETTSTGSGIAHENRPPYYALAFIMKA